MGRLSGSAPMTAMCRSRAMARRPGRTWWETSAGWGRIRGSPPSRPAASTKRTAYATFDRHTFGDMKPYVYKTTDYGQTWTALPAQESGVRGFAHVIKEDTVDRNVLFLGTEFGLWISVDGGQRWAQYKGTDFPAVPVDDIAVQARESDLVLATHGRGIWIVDDISPSARADPGSDDERGDAASGPAVDPVFRCESEAGQRATKPSMDGAGRRTRRSRITRKDGTSSAI